MLLPAYCQPALHLGPASLSVPTLQLWGYLPILLLLDSVELRRPIPLHSAATHQFYGHIKLWGEIVPNILLITME